MNLQTTKAKLENSLSVTMPHVAEDYEIPIELNYYHNQENFDNSDKQNNTQNIKDYTKQEFKESSGTNNIYQNTTIKVRPFKNNLDTPTFIRKSKKQKFLVTTPRN